MRQIEGRNRRLTDVGVGVAGRGAANELGLVPKALKRWAEDETEGK